MAVNVLKKKLAKESTLDSQKEAEKERPCPSSSFSLKQILTRSINKAERLLKLSPRKKVKVIGSLVKKFKLRIAVAKNKAGSKENELSQEEKKWLENLLEKTDITYTDAVPSMSEWIAVNVNTSKKDTFCGKFVIYLILLTHQRL